VPRIDLILTAANRAQARGYLHELRQRRSDGLLDAVESMLVVPDPGGRRAGSGTATLLALQALVRRAGREQRDRAMSAETVLASRRVLIIHSGGDSRRLPAYAAHGKIFTPLPCSDRPPLASALFDLILDDLLSIDWPRTGGVIVASGDVFLGIAKHRLRFDDAGIQCVVCRGDLQRAARHGVFIADEAGRVREVLQKPDEAALRARSDDALDAGGRALIDLGVVCLPTADAVRWLDGAMRSRVLDHSAPALDLYSDMLPIVAGGQPRQANERAGRFLQSIAGSSLRVHTVADTLFFHIGSSRELLSRLTDGRAMQAISGQTCEVAPNMPGNACVFASVIDDPHISGPAVVESCWLARQVMLRGDDILVGVPRECDTTIELPPGTGLVCLPVGPRDWSAVAFGIDDDFKTPRASGGTFAGRLLATLDESFWSAADDSTLWSARLWHIGDATAAVTHAIAMLRDAPGALPARVSSASVSAAEIVSRVNRRRLIEHRRVLVREAAFADIARRVRSHVALPPRPRPAAIAPGKIARATAPVRIDIAGGWSDTPPICNDVGGAVVNVAVRLDGAQPIRAEARIIAQPLIRIRSVDLNQSIELRRAADIAAHRDPGDWAALPKAALILSGIAPSNAGADLSEWLSAVGGGVELTISSDLPKGSGLGASSILGATTLACLARLVGESPARETLIARTSALEQMMSTAGGWQDQAGGITPGCKLLTTVPGSQQIPLEQPLPIPSDFWRERILLYSTGLQRLARDILQNVVWRWLSRSRDARRIVERLREGAHAMRDHLLAGDVDAFARGVLEYWELKKAIDPGASTPAIEALIERVRPHLAAWELPGAGGGGFLFMIARDANAARRVRDLLSQQPLNEHARFFEVEIDDAGLAIEAA